MIPTWAIAFGVDEKAIIRQIPIAHAWIDSNPRKGPKRDIIRFLFNWLTKAQKFGNLVAEVKVNAYKEKPTNEDMTVEEMQEIRRRNMGGRA